MGIVEQRIKAEVSKHAADQNTQNVQYAFAYRLDTSMMDEQEAWDLHMKIQSALFEAGFKEPIIERQLYRTTDNGLLAISQLRQLMRESVPEFYGYVRQAVVLRLTEWTEYAD